MNDKSNRHLTKNAQMLRKNMTKEERHLWYDFLKALPVTVKRQAVFGRYIADFYIASASLIIELDGSQHFEEEGREADRLRDKFFAEQGIKILRFSNLDINRNFEGVCGEILKYTHTSSVCPLGSHLPLKGKAMED